MDLSTGGDLDDCRQAIIDHSTIPIGTVPIYCMIIGRRIEDLTYDVILREIERQAQQGVDYFTIHAGVLREHLPLVRPRVTRHRVARRLAAGQVDDPPRQAEPDVRAVRRDQRHHARVRRHLLARRRPAPRLPGRRLRSRRSSPSCSTLGELVHRARDAGVQVMVEGPGHVPLDQIGCNMQLAAASSATTRRSTSSGPLVTDVFPGYDHITSAIGATEARPRTAPPCSAT